MMDKLARCGASTPPLRVVIADDSQVFCNALSIFLKYLPNLTVVGVALDGEAAVQLVEALAPDVLLLDLRMPKLNGWEVLQRLHATGVSVQTIILSAQANRSSQQRALDQGAAAFVDKGNAPLLRETLHKLMQQGGRSRSQ